MKRYLQSVEEVVKALKEGKDVIDKQDMSVYKIIDGVICHKYDDRTIINAGLILYLYKKDEFYTEEAEPLKFEVNRAYKTREGLKVFLFEKRENKNNEIVYCFVGVDNNYKIYDFTTGRNGKYCIDNRDSSFDIVGYWEEEK